ncbi:MAG: AAA family ATPase, partial [Elusimicrobiota bacterium]|nr:AAA family ATPase [Elusimicrobiota bacterium]
MEYSRWYEDLIKNGLKHSRVVIVSGVRQCGKTTLLKRIYSDSDNNFTFRSLDDDDLLQLALDDPKGFIKHQAKTMIIDEVQKAPKLLPAVKMAVDKSNDKGQFLLTGSADINLLPEVYESLAGRIRNIRLRPLTQGEILLRKPSFLNNVLKLKFPAQIKGYDKREIVKLAFRGGYPEVLTLSEKERNSWFKNYVNAILMRDLRNISNISRFESIISLFPILSSWSSKFIDLSAIATNLGTSRNTLRSYITLLKTLFLFDEIPA